MAPRSKGAVTINLRDLQRELCPASTIPTAPRPEGEAPPTREPNYRQKDGNNNGRWADRADEESEVDEWRPQNRQATASFDEASDEPWRNDNNNNNNNNNNSGGNANNEAQEDVDFGMIRNRTAAENTANKSSGSQPNEEDINFSNVRSRSRLQETASAETNTLDEDIDFANVRESTRALNSGSVSKVSVDQTGDRPAHLRLKDRLKKPVLSEVSSQNATPPAEVQDPAKPGRYVPPGKRGGSSAVHTPEKAVNNSRAAALLNDEPVVSQQLVEVSKMDAKVDAKGEQPVSSCHVDQDDQQVQQDKQDQQDHASNVSNSNKSKDNAKHSEGLGCTPAQQEQDCAPEEDGGAEKSAETSADSALKSKFVPSRVLQERQKTTKSENFAEEAPITLQPVKLASLVASNGGSSPSTNASLGNNGANFASATVQKSQASGEASKYVPPSMRKSAKKENAAPAAQPSALDKFLGRSPVMSKYETAKAAAAEEEKKRQETERKERELLEKASAIRQAQIDARMPFVCPEEDAEKVQEFIKQVWETMQNSGSKVCAETGLLETYSNVKTFTHTLVPALSIYGLFLKFLVQKLPAIAHFNSAAKPVAALLKKCLNLVGENVANHTQLFLRHSATITHEAGCPRLSAEISCAEAIFDLLLFEFVIPQPEFVKWLEDIDDSTTGRMQVMFQLTYWGQWLRGELGLEDDQVSSEENDSDIEALVPKRRAPVRVSRR